MNRSQAKCCALASLAALCGTQAGAQTQIHVPAQSLPNGNELNSRSNYPLMRSATRAQFVIAQSELGAATTLTSLALRWDGPSIGAAGGTLASLDVYLGAAAYAPAQSGASFAGNVAGGLTQVAAITSRTFSADASPNPSAWGGTAGELQIVFTTPYAYVGGNLVVELRTNGNTNAGATPANCQLDAEEDKTGGGSGGSAGTFGAGCNGASMAVSGQLVPGGVVSCHGVGFGASLPVVSVLGVSRTLWGSTPLPLDLGLIGAPGCWLHNDWLLDRAGLADASGAVAAYDPALSWAIPASGSLNGGTLQMQVVALKPVNTLGIVTTNNVQVTLGVYTPAYRGYAAHFHHLDRDAAVASLNLPAVFAMRFN